MNELASTLQSLSAQHKFYALIGGVAFLLALASVIGWRLKSRLTLQSSEKQQKIVQNLVSRVNAWWVMVAIFAVAFLAGKTGCDFIIYFHLLFCIARIYDADTNKSW
jgi:predicted CDP-diglyceride synthetase/phosphatidate cytidylyltransferase